MPPSPPSENVTHIGLMNTELRGNDGWTYARLVQFSDIYNIRVSELRVEAARANARCPERTVFLCVVCVSLSRDPLQVLVEAVGADRVNVVDLV